MISIEIASAVMIAMYVVARTRLDTDWQRFLTRLAWLVVASWIAEETAIRAYGFYAYSPGWSIFVGHVPLAVILIWPAVIHSAWDTSRYLLRRGRSAQAAPAAAGGLGRMAIVGGLLVLADASLIEPISVRAGLWHWTEPGLFEVPPIGIMGWGFHGAWCMAVFQHNERQRRSARYDAAILLVSPLGTHALLLAAWWGALRWVNVELNPWPVVAVAWGLSLLLAIQAVRHRARERIPPAEMWTRVPAAALFFVLLFLYGRQTPALVVYALAFAPPYIALTRLPRGTARSSTAPSRSGTL